MRRGIVDRTHPIDTFGDDGAFFDDHATEGAAASRANIFEGELNGASHESAVHVKRFRHRVIVKGLPISGNLAPARKSVVMDSFAVASLESKYKRRRQVRKLFLAIPYLVSPTPPTNRDRYLRRSAALTG